MGAPHPATMDKLMCLAGILVFSFIEMWCSIAICVQLDNYSADCEDEYAWAIVAGLVSTVFCIVLLILSKVKPDLLEGIVGMILAALMFGIWIAAVAVCTFDKPYAPGPTATTSTWVNVNQAGNGYFATWLALCFSGVFVLQAIPAAAAAAEKGGGALDFNKKMLLGIAFASLVEMWHAAKICDDSDKCERMLAWGVAAGAIGLIISLFWCIITKFVVSLDAHTKWVAVVLTAFWVSAVVTLTMPNGEKSCSSNDYYCKGLFLTVSNGFLGSWVALCLSLVLTASCFGVDVGGDGGSAGAQGSGHSHSHTTTTTTTTSSSTTKSETGVEANETRN